MRTLLAASLALLLAPPLARADAVDPEPDSCPSGSRPSTAHSGPYCAPNRACADDSECTEGTCMEVQQCVEVRDCGGMPVPGGPPCTLEHVLGPCDGDGRCATGECRTRQACVTGGGGCGVARGGHAPRAAAAVGILALGLALRRRSSAP